MLIPFQVAIPVAQGVLESVPTLVTQGARFRSKQIIAASSHNLPLCHIISHLKVQRALPRFAGSVVRAANETSPIFLEGIAEFTGSHYYHVAYLTKKNGEKT